MAVVLCRYEEVDNLLLDIDFERPDGCVKQSTVYSHHSVDGLVDEYFLCPVGVYGTMVEELAREEQVESLDELRHLRVVNHGDIEHAIIGNGVGRLPVASCASDAYRHDATLDTLGVDADVHLVLHALEDHEQE